MDLRSAFELACFIDVAVPKPGNVSFQHSFDNLNAWDFVRSAVACGPIIAETQGIGIGILESIAATKQVAQSNTNLGILLLCVPLSISAPDEIAGRRDLTQWQARIGECLTSTTVMDAEFVYRAIRIAQPGGMGTVPENDIIDDPTQPLWEIMKSAADRDRIAKTWEEAFAGIFSAAEMLIQYRERGMGVQDAALKLFFDWLASAPDSLIARKRGDAEAWQATRMAMDTLQDAGWSDPPSPQNLLRMDAWCREFGNQRNPGTTADLTVATWFVALASGAVEDSGWAG